MAASGSQITIQSVRRRRPRRGTARRNAIQNAATIRAATSAAPTRGRRCSSPVTSRVTTMPLPASATRTGVVSLVAGGRGPATAPPLGVWSPPATSVTARSDHLTKQRGQALGENTTVVAVHDGGVGWCDATGPGSRDEARERLGQETVGRRSTGSAGFVEQ